MLFNINETGISGSITKLATGESYLVAGDNINIVTGSNGQVTISATTLASSLYGDGSDGNVTINSNTTLSRNMYYSSLTINSGSFLYPAGYTVFVNGELLVEGTIDNSGANATVGVTTGGIAGTNGGNGGNAPNGQGQDVVNGIPGVNARGGGGFGAGGNGAYNTSDVAAYAYWLPFAALGGWFDGSTFKKFPGGAGGGASASGGWGGGAGAGVVRIAATKITIAATGAIKCDGGNGAGASVGGSGGGGGGLITLLSKQPVENNGTISVNGGTAGSGFGGNPGASGLAGIVIKLLNP